MKSSKLLLALFASGAVVLAGIVAPQSSSAAQNCKSTLGLKPVGLVQYNNVTIPVVPFTYPKGGIMDPPPTVGVAAISSLHAPLNSIVGSSVIIWHRDYNGCIGLLNGLLKAKTGGKVLLVDTKGKKTSYTIRKTYTVKVGGYKKEWFTLNGLRQIVLVTCTGPFANGHHTENFVVVATPT